MIFRPLVPFSVWLLLLCGLANATDHFGIIPPKLDDEETVVDLSSPFGTVCVGGGGRYLVFHLPEEKKLVVFDVNTAKISGEIPEEAENVVCAAGLDSLYVGIAWEKTIKRWNLETCKLEATTEANLDQLKKLGIGSACSGPLLLLDRNNRRFFVDAKSLEPFDVTAKDPFRAGRSSRLQVAATGRLFSNWEGPDLLTLYGDHTESKQIAREDFVSFHPNDLGTTFVSPRALFSSALQVIPEESPKFREGTIVATATHGPFYVEAPFDKGRSQEDLLGSVRVFALGNQKEFATLENVRLATNLYTGNGRVRADARIFLIPKANLLITLPEPGNKIVLRKFDVEAALSASGQFHLLVNSVPKTSVSVGDEFVYKVRCLASNGPVKCKLLTGPKGMTVTESGDVHWRATAVPTTYTSAVIGIEDATGQKISHAISLRVEGKKLDTTESLFPSPPRDAPATTAISPLEMSDDEVVVKFPAVVHSTAVGGGGRYIALYFKSLNQIGIFDVTVGELTHFVPAEADNVELTASQDSLFVLLTGLNVIQRWSLVDGTRQAVRKFDAKQDLVSIAAGSASKGPLLAGFKSIGPGPGNPLVKGKMIFLKEQSLEDVALSGPPAPKNPYGFAFNSQTKVTVSADGQTFVILGHLIQIQGTRVIAVKPPAIGVDYVAPGPSGETIFTPFGKYKFGDEEIPDWREGSPMLPSHGGRYFVTLPKENSAEGLTEGMRHSIGIYVPDAADPIATVEDVRIRPVETLYPQNAEGSPLPSRLFFIPEANLIVTIPLSADRAFLKKVDIKDAIKKSGQPYLFVESKPPRELAVGESLAYQIEVGASHPPLKYAMTSGPDGATVSPTGEVTWTAAQRPVGGQTELVVSVSDVNSKEVQHSFRVSVTRDSREPVLIAKDRLELEDSSFTKLFQGLGHLLVLQDKRLIVTGADGTSVQKRLELEKTYAFIGERKDYFVALAKEPSSIDLLDKNTGKVKSTYEWKSTWAGLALHPKLPIAYACYFHSVDIPKYRFIIFDEKQNKAYEDEAFIGNDVIVDPRGRFLISRYYSMYERGARLLFNPQRINVVPEYGTLNWVIRYDLQRDGKPESVAGKSLDEYIGELSISADGERLATTGSFLRKTSPCWNTSDFSEVPKHFDLGKVSGKRDTACHPSADLVACVAEGGPRIYSLRTAEEEPDRISYSDDLLANEELVKLTFSPDGKQLVLLTTSSDVNYLVSIPINLTATEVRVANAALKNKSSDNPVTSSIVLDELKVPIARFDAFAGGQGKKMEPKDIARWFTNSVVIIKGSRSSGTGFVISQDGHIVTCAHCLEGLEDPVVEYREQVSGKVVSKSIKAKVVSVDHDRDLALLLPSVKIDVLPVRLEMATGVETGEKVFAIGHPGLGSTILDYTMTEGIVSTPRRELESMPFIQTSAAVNPGSSGAPLFSGNGLVVGVVAEKAKIEGAAFAIPAEDVMRFILSAAQTKGEAGKFVRTWVDSTGKHSVVAEFGGLNNGEVTLIQKDGKKIALPLSSLSSGDQAFAKELTRVNTGD